jgi:hypothetical protein
MWTQILKENESSLQGVRTLIFKFNFLTLERIYFTWYINTLNRARKQGLIGLP